MTSLLRHKRFHEKFKTRNLKKEEMHYSFKECSA